MIRYESNRQISLDGFHLPFDGKPTRQEYPISSKRPRVQTKNSISSLLKHLEL